MNWLSSLVLFVVIVGFTKSDDNSTTVSYDVGYYYNVTYGGPTSFETSTEEINSSHNNTDRGWTSGKIPIYLGGFLSIDGDIWDGSGMLPAIELALEHINARSDVLANYELRMVWNDSQCDAGLGTRFLFDQLFHEPQKLMIIGPACSPDGEAVAQTSFYWNLITMSYSAASPALSNRDDYPYFFRTYVPDSMYNPARILLMKEFNWTKVATIHTNYGIFSFAIDNLRTLLKQANITLLASESFLDSPENQMEYIKKTDAHIIVANMYERSAMKVFCEAYRLGMYGENYMWMLIGWYGRYWWRDEAFRDENITCTAEEIQEVILSSMYISTEVENIDQSGKETVSGYTASEIVTMFEERLTWPRYQGFTASGLDYFAYDAAWAIALTLNQSSAVMEAEGLKRGSRRNLEDFNYDDKEMAQLFFTELQKLKFQGATGHVRFADADRVGPTRVEQLQGSCAEGWHLRGIYCYRFVENETISWSEARSACASYSDGYLCDSVLVPITSEADFQVLVKIWEDCGTHSPEWHIGLHQRDAQLRWVNVSNDVPTWISEEKIFQNPTSEKNCYALDFRNGGSWVSVGCEDENRPYICRKIADFDEQFITDVLPDDQVKPDFSLLKWPGGTVPMDHSPGYTYIDVHHGITLNLYIAVGSITIVCMLMAVFFLVFNIYFANQRFVKLSSPKFNNLIIIGSMLIYSSILVAGLEVEDILGDYPSVCMARTWMVSVGFVLAFGAMFSKTWRVHRVASFKTPKRRIVTDGQLFGIVGFLLILDIVILTSWQFLDPQQREIVKLPEQLDSNVEMQMLRPFIHLCTSEQELIWSSVLYGYKGILLIFGTFLAWETRKVTIPALNDSKLIGLSVYNVITLCAIGLGVDFALRDKPEASFLFISSIMLFCTTATLIVIFVPKIISVYKDPRGENDIARNTCTTKSSEIRRQSTLSMKIEGVTNSLVEENRLLKEEVSKLKKMLPRPSTSEPSFSSSIERSEGDLPTNTSDKGGGCGVWIGGVILGCAFGSDKDHQKNSSD